MIYSNGYADETAAKKIYDYADDICFSQMPEIIALNLHPQNFEQTVKMHDAVLNIIESGFYPLAMKQCFNWFNRKAEASVHN